jgi:hypothetical protein
MIVLFLYIYNVKKWVDVKFYEIYGKRIEVNMNHINTLKDLEIIIQVYDLRLKKMLEMILELKLKIY